MSLEAISRASLLQPPIHLLTTSKLLSTIAMVAPPPPSFLNPTPPSLSPVSATFSPAIISVVGVLGLVFLLVSYYTLVVKYCTSRDVFRRSRAERENREVWTQNEAALPMLTRGLEESVIKMIPVFKYSKRDGLVEGTECAVCLSEFEENEDLRLLPKCSHAFHLPCIDNWLQSHSNCPLCRANIMSPIPASTPAQHQSPPPQQPVYGSLDEESGRSHGPIGHTPEQIAEDRISAYAIGDGQVIDRVAEGESANKSENHGEVLPVLKPEENTSGSYFDGSYTESGPLSPAQMRCFSTGFIWSDSQEHKQKHGDSKLVGDWKRKAEHINPLSYFRRSYSTGSAGRHAAMDQLPRSLEPIRASTSRFGGAKSSTIASSDDSATTARRWGTGEEMRAAASWDGVTTQGDGSNTRVLHAAGVDEEEGLTESRRRRSRELVTESLKYETCTRMKEDAAAARVGVQVGDPLIVGKMLQSLKGSLKIKRSFSSSGTRMLAFIHTNSSSTRRSGNPCDVESGTSCIPLR